MTDYLRQIVRDQKRGHVRGIYSVCSAHPLVIEAALKQCLQDGTDLLVEATSNQVDQYGGYTGMTPIDFRNFVEELADAVSFPRERLILGGDHLGPNRWQGEPAEQAMAKAVTLVQAYVGAGYTKIHLDCSMSCAGDPVPLGDELVAARAARLLAAAEETAAEVGLGGAISYVIGTEVPVPGGAHETLGALTPTSVSAAEATISAHKEAFAAAGLAHLWPQIVALVVQPAVEFDHVQVIDYVSSATEDLRHVLDDEPNLLFEAHSTDYQTAENLRDLVADHWGILKVGPGLTFALREGLFALAAIEDQLIADPGKRSNLLEVIEGVMLAEPRYWQGYYEGDATELKIARRFSYSDRMRYYLPTPQITAAVAKLFDNLDEVGIPEPLLSQYLPDQYRRLRAGEVEAKARELVIDRVRDALRPYAFATIS